MSASGPATQQNQTSDAMLTSGPAALTKDPCLVTDRSVETTTLHKHTWKTDEYSAQTLP